MHKAWLAHYPAKVPSSYDYPKEPLPTFLFQSAQRYPNHEAMWFMGKSTSYRELLDAVRHFASATQSLSLVKGDRIAIMLPNCPQSVISYYGALLAGLVVVQTNPMYTPRELTHQLKDSGAKAIVTLDIFMDRVEQAVQDTEIQHVIVTSIKDYLPFMRRWLYQLQAKRQGQTTPVPTGGRVVSMRRLLEHASPHPAPVLVHSEDLALIQYTGGTTGAAKGVMLTHANLVANTVQCRLWAYRLEEGRERYLAVLPFFHVFGMTALMNQSIYTAGTLILVPRFRAGGVLHLIQKQRPTVFPGAPTMYIALLNHPKVASYDLSSIQVCISGAAPLPTEVQEQFERVTGGRLIEGYGLSEASPITHANNLWDERRKGIGIPFPDTDAKVVDELGGEVPPGVTGELVIRGPQVMKGYWNRPEESALAIRDGWLYTGDMACMDADGFFQIIDRRKDLIIAGGFNIYPREVEEVLYAHPSVEEAAVVGVPDEYRGETVKAYVVLKQGKQVTPDELNAWCRANLAAFKVPRSYEIRESLPKSLVGKVLKRKLVEENRDSGSK